MPPVTMALGMDDDGSGDNSTPPPARRYLATCVPGLEPVLSAELLALGASDVQPSGSAAVTFSSSPEDERDIGLRAVLWSRTAHRIMELLAATGETSDKLAADRDDLYNFIRNKIDVAALLTDANGRMLTLSVASITNGPLPRDLCHSHYTALTVKNALVDAARDDMSGRRPDVDLDDPDVPLVVALRGMEVDEDGNCECDVSLYRCLHAGSLHRRGYRLNDDEGRGGRNEGRGADGNGDDRRRLDDEYNSRSADDDYADVDDYFRGGGRRGRRDRSTGDGGRGRGGGRGGRGGGGRGGGRRKGGALIHAAALKESLAAGLLLHAGYDKLVGAARADGGAAVLLDPSCGSGTYLVEAALIAGDVAPGLVRARTHPSEGDGGGEMSPHRKPPVVRWGNYLPPGDDALYQWRSLLADASSRAKEGLAWLRRASSSSGDEGEGAAVVIMRGNDVNPRSAELARKNVAGALLGLEDVVRIDEGDCADWDLGGEGTGATSSEGDDTGEGDGGGASRRVVVPGRTIVVANPPWGLRIGTGEHDGQSSEESWVALRTFLRREADGAEAWVLSGDAQLTRNLRMKKTRSIPLKTGGVNLRWIQYHVFGKGEAAGKFEEKKRNRKREESGSGNDRGNQTNGEKRQKKPSVRQRYGKERGAATARPWETKGQQDGGGGSGGGGAWY